jgi:hypothetical protein
MRYFSCAQFSCALAAYKPPPQQKPYQYAEQRGFASSNSKERLQPTGSRRVAFPKAPGQAGGRPEKNGAGLQTGSARGVDWRCFCVPSYPFFFLLGAGCACVGLIRAQENPRASPPREGGGGVRLLYRARLLRSFWGAPLGGGGGRPRPAETAPGSS